MKPERDSSLVDLLDGFMNKGLILNADLIITVAGIPMIGLNLRAALASMETMLDYGMMEAWDKATLEWYAREKSALLLMAGEEVLFKSFGYIWQSQGIIGNWLPGVWHVTDRRLILWRRDPAQILFEVPLQKITALHVEKARNERTELNLAHSRGSARIYLSSMDGFREALKKAMMPCLMAALPQ